MRLWRLFLLVPLGSTVLSGAIVTLGPGVVLEASFTSTPNTADLLVFFQGNPLTFTGSPVITTQLFDGSTLIASVSGPPVIISGSPFLQVLFYSPASIFTGGGLFQATVADLTSMRSGTIQGKIRVMVTGGSLTGLDTAFLNLFDAKSAGGGFSGQADLTRGPVTVTGPPPVPALSDQWLVVLAIALLFSAMALSRRTRYL
jgi:hypothetical protein